jgi:hypothetical protein
VPLLHREGAQDGPVDAGTDVGREDAVPVAVFVHGELDVAGYGHPADSGVAPLLGRVGSRHHENLSDLAGRGLKRELPRE